MRVTVRAFLLLMLILAGCTRPVAGQNFEDLGVGQVTLTHPSGYGFFWTGLNSPTNVGGGATITSGENGTIGTPIVYIDLAHLVSIQIAGTNTIQVHNGNSFTVAGNVTLIW